MGTVPDGEGAVVDSDGARWHLFHEGRLAVEIGGRGRVAVRAPELDPYVFGLVDGLFRRRTYRARWPESSTYVAGYRAAAGAWRERGPDIICDLARFLAGTDAQTQGRRRGRPRGRATGFQDGVKRDLAAQMRALYNRGLSYKEIGRVIGQDATPPFTLDWRRVKAWIEELDAEGGR